MKGRLTGAVCLISFVNINQSCLCPVEFFFSPILVRDKLEPIHSIRNTLWNIHGTIMYFPALYVLLVVFSCASFITASVTTRQDVKNGSTESAPNPIGQQYPFSITGTINGTLSVLPIPYSLARSIIPAKYRILKGAYRSLIPGFPHDSYPVSEMI